MSQVATVYRAEGLRLARRYRVSAVLDRRGANDEEAASLTPK
jgi:hypothetical protein